MPDPDLQSARLASDLKTAEFIAKAREVHGDTYGYEETRFVNSRTEIRIRCLRHGIFPQSPGKHLRGNGCKPCGAARRGAEQSRAAGEAFASKGREKHGDRYGYEEVAYQDAKTKVTIICRVHGPFPQKPYVHLMGSGCPDCGTEAMATSRLSKTAANYIERVRKVHGDRYDYSDTVFKGSRTKVTIRCRVHGPFPQYPYGHLDGLGCRKCGSAAHALKRRKPRVQFIAEAQSVHGHIYDYSQVDYRQRSDNVTIVCAIHGPFPQAPGHHLQGRGCPKCGQQKQADALRRSLLELVAEAQAVHGDRYDYGKVDYKDSDTEVTIICAKHGPFPQLSHVHLKGSGCKRCATEKVAALRRKDTPTFIRDAKEVHGDRYGYGLVRYTANDEKVTLECREHGLFEIQPFNHLNGQGCWDCGIERIRQLRQKTQAQFLADAHEVHGIRYDYSQVVYEHSHTPISIICKTHGPFPQSPSSHLSGSGCPRCNHFVSKAETEWLDSLGIPERSYIADTAVRLMVVDGYDPDTNTVYLFHGDYWHGNPDVFAPDALNHRKGKTYGELYRVTMDEEQGLRDAGYTVVSVWEKDYKRGKNN